MEIPANFSPDVVRIYKALNDEYVPNTAVKHDGAELVLKVLAMDVWFILGCGLKWDKIVPVEDPFALAKAPPLASAADADDNPDRSGSASPACDPLDFSV